MAMPNATVSRIVEKTGPSVHALDDQSVHEGADQRRQADRDGHHDERLAVEDGGQREREIGREHHEFAVGQVQHAAHAVHEHVAERQQGVRAGEHQHVDRELHQRGATSTVSQSRRATMRSWRSSQ